MTLPPDAAAIIDTVVDAFNTNFPNRIRAIYLIGSYADGTAVAWSDIDLIVIIRDAFRDDDEKKRAGEVASECGANSLIRLDVTPRGENEIRTMQAVIRVGLKQGSKLV